jgi:hypothetical protein
MYVAVPKRFNAAGQKNAPTVERDAETRPFAERCSA